MKDSNVRIDSIIDVKRHDFDLWSSKPLFLEYYTFYLCWLILTFQTTFDGV